MRSIANILKYFAAGAIAVLSIAGCAKKAQEYGTEKPVILPGAVRQTWAVAPVIDLSGQRVDPILQADVLYGQLQQVDGLTVVPVNRVVQVYQALRLPQVQTEEQAALVCEMLGVDALVIASITLFDPFDPPRMGASVQLFRRGGYRRPLDVDPRELARRATLPRVSGADSTAAVAFPQAVGIFDAANGSTREGVLRYAQGRTDQVGPLKDRAYFLEMDRYSGFVYASLIEDLLRKPGVAGE